MTSHELAHLLLRQPEMGICLVKHGVHVPVDAEQIRIVLTKGLIESDPEPPFLVLY